MVKLRAFEKWKGGTPGWLGDVVGGQAESN